MGWKEWSLWMKGGVLGGVFGILFIGMVPLLEYFNASLSENLSDFIETYLLSILALPLFLAERITPLICHDTGWFACLGSAVYLAAFWLVIELAVVGAAIGWIVGKLTGKRKKKSVKIKRKS